MSSVAHTGDLITREGYERLRTELETLRNQRLPQVADELRVARGDGDEPGENVGLAAALDDRAAIERRIDELEATLSRVRIADPPPEGVAALGQRVRVRLGAGARPRDCRLVSALEADASRGDISVESPIGQALLGLRAGDVVEVQTPGGKRSVELLAVG